MKGSQPFIFICITRLDRAGDCAEQRRGNIIPAALRYRMKPFILHGAYQKRSFDAQQCGAAAHGAPKRRLPRIGSSFIPLIE